MILTLLQMQVFQIRSDLLLYNDNLKVAIAQPKCSTVKIFDIY